MRNYRTVFTCFLATLLAVLVAGCGQETVTIPGVVSVTPAQGAVNVAVNATISATFSQAMSAASINGTTFTLAGPGGAAMAGTTVTLDATGKIATLAGATLANNTAYTATITTGATTPGGSALMGNYTWTFSTVAAIPPPPLSVTVTPAAFAQNVTLSATISATFSQAMNCATLVSPATSFTVTDPGGVAVPGTVTCSSEVATFMPTGGALASYGTTYTATITTGAMDVLGTSLADGAYVWTFTTIPLPPVMTQAPAVTLTNPVTPNATAIPPVLEDTIVPTNLAAVSAKFNEPMDSGTIIGANFTLTYLVLGVPTPVAGGTVSYVPSTNSMVFHL